MSTCGVTAATGLSRREFKRACVQVFTLCVAAVPLIKSDAKGAAVVLFDQVGGFDFRCGACAGLFAFARLRASLAFPVAFAVFAFAVLAWRGFLGWRGRFGSVL